MPTQNQAEQEVSPGGRVWLRLLAAIIALGAGVAALIVAIQLVHSALG